MKLVKRLSCLFLLSTMVFLGCSTQKRFVRETGPIAITAEDLGMTLSLRYVSNDEIVKRFGKKNNPFLAPASLLSMNQFLLFELSIVTDQSVTSPFTVQLADMEIQFGGINTSPTNRFLLTSLWNRELRPQMEDKKYSGWTMGKIKSVVKKNIFPNEFQIKRGDRQRGLLLFKGSFPKYGEAVVYVPVVKDGIVAQNFSFTMEFGSK